MNNQTTTVVFVKITCLLLFLTVIYAFYKPTAGNAGEKGLKDYYKNYFPIGVAVAPNNLQSADTQLILQHFNSVTCENVMKMGPIHPEENRYNWEPADQIVAFVNRHHLKMRGHTLCWHNQAPRWMFRDTAGNTVSKEVLLQRLKDHINAVVNRYKGSIYAWDVVNEVIADDSATNFRNSQWYQVCGEDFVAKAFEYAHAADPEAKLFYNDYNTEHPAKRQKIYNMLKKLLDAKVPVHGVGLQGHWNVYDPLQTELKKSIELFASLGLDVQVTELDMSVYKPGRPSPADSTGFTGERKQLQIDQYKTVFDILRQHKKQITGVTFWNVSDRRSWLDNRGRKNYPLLFDQENKPKEVYYEVVKF